MSTLKKLEVGSVTDTEEQLKDFEPEQRVELYEGLELWYVNIAVLREQSLNAQSMATNMFLALTETIKRDSRLESMPLCAWQDGKLELISGHHRVRAARKAEFNNIWVLVDVSGISRDQLLAKQLAHNAITGSSDPDIIAQIFREIEDVDAKIEAFVDPDMSGLSKAPKLTSKDLDVYVEARVVTLVFLDAQKAVLEKALERLTGDEDEVWLAAREEYDLLTDTVNAVSNAYDIRSMPTIFAKMAEIVLEHVEGAEDKLPNPEEIADEQHA